MYQIKPVEFIRNLQKCLKKNGMIASQEHDMEMVPSNTQPMPLHCKLSTPTSFPFMLNLSNSCIIKSF